MRRQHPSAETLIFEGAVSNFALTMKEHRTPQRIAGLALVETGMTALAQRRIGYPRISHGSCRVSVPHFRIGLWMALCRFSVPLSRTGLIRRDSQCTRLKFSLANDPADEVQFQSG